MRQARFTMLSSIVALSAAAAVVSGQPVRFATYNLSLNRNAAGDLLSDLQQQNPTNSQVVANRIQHARTVAEIVQRNAPDVLLVNEFDYYASPSPTDQGSPLNLFGSNFLNQPQNTLNLPQAAPAQNYPHRFAAPSNTGIASGFDLNNNGVAVTTPGAPGYGDDAFGFGNFQGQFGMAFYSKYPVTRVRTFQNFLWKDMPGNLLTNDPTLDNPNTTVNENLNGFYSPDEINALRLSSKSHWDIELNVNGKPVHVLAAHPTPPVFDGTEDRNGKRNFDEIRFWKDYVNGATYMYDDNGVTGGLSADASFVIMGDYNADPNDGDAYTSNGVFGINQLLADPKINTAITPDSPGGPQAAGLQGGANATHLTNPAFDTADFADGAPGNLRADYALPSSNGLELLNGDVFWPQNTDPLFPLVGVFNSGNLWSGFQSSDHKLTFVDVIVPEPSGVLAIAGLITLASHRRRGR